MTARGRAPARPPARVCVFGTYAREYTVTRLLALACRSAGIEVIECHRPLWEETPHKDAGYFGSASALRLAARYVRIAFSLARARHSIGPVPMYLIGFNGQFDCMLLRLLTLRRRAPVVFAPLVTLTDTLIEDRALFGPKSVRAAGVRLADRLSLAAVTHVVIDTEAHREYIIEALGVAPERVTTWHLGADPDVFVASPPAAEERPVRVLFYGSYLPLHGVRTVLEAAELLKQDQGVEFLLAGDGPERAASDAYARKAGLGQVHFTDWVAYRSLGEMVAAADICLGIFGTTRKTQMVIPNKVYQAATVGRAVISADTPAAREVFTHGETAWLCPAGNPQALADAIRRLAGDVALRTRLGAQAARLMREQFSLAARGGRLAAILAGAMERA